MSAAMHRGFALAATAVVIGSIVWGFVVAGSPETRRQRRLDERRIDALQDIRREIRNLVLTDEDRPTMRSPLPLTLDELKERINAPKLVTTDPETGEPFGYQVLTESSYALTATFTFERNVTWKTFWNHPPGECTFTIDVLVDP